ncbi:MAG: cytochrome c biogenesis protein CcdA, partial [Thermomicrobiaceae bacterium]|nr:cytochrome c biogenesis protein CcdA [Thermomicrobiaceae bacterium]
MAQAQAAAVHWLSVLVALLPVGYAYGAGMIAAVNPCGFAMLPAYLSLYLGIEEGRKVGGTAWRRLAGALLVGVTVSSGFVLLFAAAGLAISAGGRFLVAAIPWLALLVGVALTGLGVWLLAGRTLSPAVFEALASRVGTPGKRSLRGFFLFGLAYGLASLSCTLPVFLVAVGSALTSGSLARGVVQFLTYGLGMATVVVALTVALSLFKLGLVRALHQAIPYVQRVAAALLVVAGIYIVLYWS